MNRSTPILFSAFLMLAGCEHMPAVFGTGEASPQAKISSHNLSSQGFELLTQQQPSAAITVFDQAIGSDPQNIKALQGKGIALDQMGKHDEAQSVYESALKIDPKSVAITNNFAMSKILTGQYQQAIDLLTPISGNDTAKANLALANCLMGKNAEAKSLYGKALSPKETDDNMRFCGAYKSIKK